MTVRRATSDDLEEVLGVIERADAAGDASPPQGASGDRKRVTELLAAAGHHNEVAEADGRVVAYANLHDRPDGARLAYLFVDPDYQGRGIGTRLMERALVEARRRGHRRAKLGTAVKNRRAREYYERAGWLDTGDRKYNADLGLEMCDYALDLEAP